MFRKVILGIILISTSLLTGCGGAYVGNIQYSQQPDLQTQKVTVPQTITVVTFNDSRVDYPESDKKIGRLVGGFGDTLQSIEIPQSLSVAVTDVTSDLLTDAGYKTSRSAGSSPGYTLSGDIVQFYTMFFYVHKVAIEINLVLTDNETKKEVWKGTASNYFGGSLFERYPKLKNDPTIGCLGFTCHSKGINVAMNNMLIEALSEAWNKGGLKVAMNTQ
ncbi:MAG: DUF4136 domain-containing protein [Desulfobacula sp.]|jgi:hypothetical protein